METKWICNTCGAERAIKPYKNEPCTCGGRFRKYSKCECGNWYLSRKGKKYCGADCRGYDVRPREKAAKIKCDSCGREFIRSVKAVQKNKHNFCCKECADKYKNGKTEKKKCLHCGKEFDLYLSTLEKSNASGKYCSRECYWASMRKDEPGKNRYYGFNRAKKKYFNGLQFCAICGNTKDINIHHIIPNRITHDQRKENLIPLCKKHHAIIESLTRNVLEVTSDYDMAFFMLTNILRQRQIETYCYLEELLSDRNKD